MRLVLIVAASFSLAASAAFGQGYVAPDGRTEAQLIAAHVLPDLAHPGAFNTKIAPTPEAVTPAMLKATVCKANWTATVRPPVAYTNRLKVQLLPPGHMLAEYELDHLKSIEDLGSPDSPQNLWMMVYDDRYGARVKDVLETRVKHLLCAGKITVRQAQDALAPNWMVGYVTYVGPLPK